MKYFIALGFVLCMARASAAEVMTWVPSYSIAPSYTALTKDFGGIGMKDGLSRVALQFWRPTATGSLAKDSAYGIISDADIKKFSDWGNEHNIEIMLCIYNPPLKEGEPWDWPLAQAAFNNSTVFVEAILREIKRLEALGISIAGVDMDLESSGEQSAKDRDRYLAMMKLLSKKLKGSNKKLTVATYQHKFNAPNWDYWPTLASVVDGITPMGYENIGHQVACKTLWGHPDNWCTYEGQISAVGKFDKQKFTLGAPGNIGYGKSAQAWMGKPLMEHLDGIQRLGAGLAIWDANLHGSWQTAEVWNKIKAIKNNSRVIESPKAKM